MDRRVLALLVSAGILAVVVVVVVAGRGGSDDGSDLTDTSTKPQVEVPGGPPPTRLQTEDIVTGDGPAARPGDQLSVQYVGVLYDTGEQFDASWDSGQPFQFQLGAGNVIPGWDRGVAGMRVGGRRELIIPPALGYGARGQPPSIPPNSTLVFVIDLLSTQGPGG